MSELKPMGKNRLMTSLALFERGIVLVLIGLMVITIVLCALEVAVLLYKDMASSPMMLLGIDQILDIFGMFLLVLLGLELLETIKAYLITHAIHVEIVMVVALIAIARKIIILDIKSIEAVKLFAIGFVALTLSIGYYLISMIYEKRHPHA